MPVCASCGHDNRVGARFCDACGSALVAPVRGTEQRKTVTVLFCDVTGSTELGDTLDPERLRALLAAYFERMKTIVEHHGGTVEKFIGDAVMAVFGVPVAHEDDALRGVRAAAEMRDALPGLGIQGRIGLMTGEVVTGTEERLATGDAVNVAARLEQAAAPGEVLVGGPTAALLGEAAELEPLAPLELKGKSGLVPAYRLLSVREAPERRHETAFVGRERELAALREAWERAQAEHRCELVTIVGDAGVGKSRLVEELLASIDARVARGRCLPYGVGITYWPVVEVLKQLDVLPADEAAATAIRSLLGETESPTAAEDIAWAFRKTLERAGADGPLVVAFDDVQWGEETFLDLVEHVALLFSGAPFLLLCLARSELAERRSGWPVAIRLEPLGDEDVAELMPEHITGELREKIARAAGGNPLFVGEMVAMTAETDGDVTVPPTLQALLAARLDQLEAVERSILERGAVEGEMFHRGAVQALTPEDVQVTPRLAALVRKELIRPDTPQLAGEDGFRFRHLLIRDAAYDALPKAVRAELHQRFAAWLEQRGAELVELDEILGYHLEQARRYRTELGLSDDISLARAARVHLTAAGRRAHFRSDQAAVGLLRRAAALLGMREIDVPLEHDLIFSLLQSGNGDEALARARSLAERAASAGDRVAELCGRIEEHLIAIFVEPEGVTNELAEIVEEALPLFEAAGDHVALYIARTALGEVANMRGQMDLVFAEFERASTHAARAAMPDRTLGWRALTLLFGTTRVPDVLAWLGAHDDREHRGYGWIPRARAQALAMLGRIDEARTILAEAHAELVDRGRSISLGTALSQVFVHVELLAGDAEAAALYGEEGCRLLDELGERSFLSTGAGWLAQALYELDRLEEADGWAERAAELGASEDTMTQVLWRQVRSKVLARAGRAEDAQRMIEEAVAMVETTDAIDQQGAVHADHGEVLVLVEKPDRATPAFERALDRYTRKGNLVMAERTRARLADVGASVA
ncbi:MAG: AAA family ATPase [Gaiellaceae bacterium]